MSYDLLVKGLNEEMRDEWVKAIMNTVDVEKSSPGKFSVLVNADLNLWITFYGVLGKKGSCEYDGTIDLSISKDTLMNSSDFIRRELYVHVGTIETLFENNRIMVESFLRQTTRKSGLFVDNSDDIISLKAKSVTASSHNEMIKMDTMDLISKLIYSMGVPKSSGVEIKKTDGKISVSIDRESNFDFKEISFKFTK